MFFLIWKQIGRIAQDKKRLRKAPPPPQKKKGAGCPGWFLKVADGFMDHVDTGCLHGP